MSAVGTIRVVILGAAVIAAAACSGKEGPMGPEGPVGPPGSPNVIYSAWFTPSPWDSVTLFGNRHFSYVKAASQITQAVLDNGVVLTFGKLTGYNPAVWPATQVGRLPISVTYQQGGLQIDTWQAYGTPGSLRINFVNSANIYTSIATTHSFRYVIVPGGVAAAIKSPSGDIVASENVGGTGYTRAQLQAMSYDEVRRVFNIPEK